MSELTLDGCLDYLKKIAAFQYDNKQRGDWVYSCIEDLVLEAGHQGVNRQLERIEAGLIAEASKRLRFYHKQCFWNARRLVERDRHGDFLVYVEGYLFSQDIPIAIEHAWVEFKENNVVFDPTATHPGAIYYGVAMPWVRGPSENDNQSEIQNYKDHWPLLREGLPS